MVNVPTKCTQQKRVWYDTNHKKGYLLPAQQHTPLFLSLSVKDGQSALSTIHSRPSTFTYV